MKKVENLIKDLKVKLQSKEQETTSIRERITALEINSVNSHKNSEQL